MVPSVYFIQSQSGYPLQIIKGRITAAELASKVVQVFQVHTYVHTYIHVRTVCRGSDRRTCSHLNILYMVCACTYFIVVYRILVGVGGWVGVGVGVWRLGCYCADSGNEYCNIVTCGFFSEPVYVAVQQETEWRDNATP